MARKRTVAKSINEFFNAFINENSTITKYKDYKIERHSNAILLRYKFNRIVAIFDTTNMLVMSIKNYNHSWRLSNFIMNAYSTDEVLHLMVSICNKFDDVHVKDNVVTIPYDVIVTSFVRTYIADRVIERAHREYNQIYGNGRVSLDSSTRSSIAYLRNKVDKVLYRLRKTSFIKPIKISLSSRITLNEYMLVYTNKSFKPDRKLLTYVGSLNNLLYNGLFSSYEYGIVDMKNWIAKMNVLHRFIKLDSKAKQVEFKTNKAFWEAEYKIYAVQKHTSN
jgi:hypothetical protein